MEKSHVICDTDVMIDYWDRNSNRYDKTKAILESSIGLNNVLLSLITKMELLLGAGNKSEESKIRKNLIRFNILLIDNRISKEAIRLF